MTWYSPSSPPASPVAALASLRSKALRDDLKTMAFAEIQCIRQSWRSLVGVAGASYQANLWQSEEDLLEHRTDGTDAFDTLYIGCEKFPQKETSSLPISGML